MTGQDLTLAHVTDVHLGPLPQARLAELLSKRAFGYLSWHRRRHRLHRLDVLEALAADLAAEPPDHIAVTGDLVNIALAAEFEQAMRWLEATGSPDHVTVVPGNHDAYAGSNYRTGWSRWHAYMQGDEAAIPGTFPFVRRLGAKAALIGLSSAVPSPVGFATGQLGPAQLEALDGLLAQLREEGRWRILLLHHPPLGPLIRRRRGLRDETTFRRVVARQGAELVLSGHQHVFIMGGLPGPAGPVPVIAGPSASLAQGHAETGGYLRYRLAGAAATPTITLQLRRFDPASGRLLVERTGRIRAAQGGLDLVAADWPDTAARSMTSRATASAD